MEIKIRNQMRLNKYILSLITFWAMSSLWGNISLVDIPNLKGSFNQGGMVWGFAIPGDEIFIDGVPIFVDADGRFVFGFSRNNPNQSLLKIIHADGRVEEDFIDVTPQSYDIERVNGLPPKTVTIPEEERQRRVIETGKVRVARSHKALNLDWLNEFIWPATGRISGVYGSQRILNGEPRSPHYGLDIAAPVHTPIYAPQGGEVVLAEPDFLLEGGIIIIDHGFQIYSTMFHMKSVDVKMGARVEKGDPIGTIGAKGRASGPHVDWRLNWGNVRLDPQLLLTNVPKPK
jgi:hypothetical protein